MKPKKEELNILLGRNSDAIRYFYSKADERWLEWLWEMGFLDSLKKPAKDLNGYSHSTPEFNYLIRMTEKKPDIVSKIINEVSVSKKTFNPEVVADFITICSRLPAKYLADIVPKLHSEGWIQLMGGYRLWEEDFAEMLLKLSDAGDVKNLILLSESILSIRSDDEYGNTYRRYSYDNPFYFEDIGYTNVFKYLRSIIEEADNETSEQVLSLGIEIFKKFIRTMNLSDQELSDGIFELYDYSILSNLNLFSQETSDTQNSMNDLFIAIKPHIRHLFKASRYNTEHLKDLYGQYFNSLPDTYAMWRLKLFVTSLAPRKLRKELIKVLFKIFELKDATDRRPDIEYLENLSRSFRTLTKIDRSKYIDQTIRQFGYRDNNIFGNYIFSAIYTNLSIYETMEMLGAGFKYKSEYRPSSKASKINRSGNVISKPPISQRDFNALPIEIIFEKLNTEWTIEQLKELDNRVGPFIDIDIMGVRKLLRIDLKNRLQEYLDYSSNFIKMEVREPAYLYIFINGVVQEINQRKRLANFKWDTFLDLCSSIVNSVDYDTGSSTLYRNDNNNTYGNIQVTLSEIAVALQGLLTKKKYGTSIDFKDYRSKIFDIMKKLLQYSNPGFPDQAEEGNTIDSTHGSYWNLYTEAINSVRGQAFKLLVEFVDCDKIYLSQSQEVSRDSNVKINNDIRKIYEVTLHREHARPILFLFGKSLPYFYSLNEKWILKLLPTLFPKDESKQLIFAAAWEGYLTNSVYEIVFKNQEFQDIYINSLDMDYGIYKKYPTFSDPNKSMPTHLAVAFMRYEDFFHENALFSKFWENGTTEMQANFISSIGSNFITAESISVAEFFENNSEISKRLINFWEWILDKFSDKKILIEFGSWINLDKKIFPVKWLAEKVKLILNKTDGQLNFDGKLEDCIVEFAREVPKEAVGIIKVYLIDGLLKDNEGRVRASLVNVWHDALEILFQNENTRESAIQLINKAMEYGSGQFENLREIIDDA